MKLNLPLMKLIIRLLILLILLVMLFIISMFLLSVKYWPDIYNYINANITIKSIPTISELNLSVIEVELTTEDGYTTDFYTDSTTTDVDFGLNVDDVGTFEGVSETKKKTKREVKIEENKDYSLLPEKSVLVDYFFDEEDTSTMTLRDIIDEKELSTRTIKDVEIISKLKNKTAKNMKTSEVADHCNKKRTSVSEAVFPWIATIFVKNATNAGQYDYFCDGALLSHDAVLTSARCVSLPNGTLAATDLLVVLGKRSLQTTGPDEDIHVVRDMKIHENFTNEKGVTKHDLVILILEGFTNFGKGIQPICLQPELQNDIELAVTAGWNVSGEITSINFGKEKSKTCLENEEMENLFCATYGDDVSLCPSYGGLYVIRTKRNLWYLQGIMSGDPTNRICANRTVKYTDVSRYRDWIYNIVHAKL